MSKPLPEKSTEIYWTAINNSSEELKRARRQAEIHQWLLGFAAGVSQKQILDQFPRCQVLLKRLQERGFIQADSREIETTLPALTTTERLPLTPAQQHVCEQICSQLSAYSTHLLEGVTGSGKTEVYFYLIEKVLQKPGAQILIVVPEIGLTPQLYNRLCKYFTAHWRITFQYHGTPTRRDVAKNSVGRITNCVGNTFSGFHTHA